MYVYLPDPMFNILSISCTWMEGRKPCLPGWVWPHCRARAPSEGQHNSAVAEYFALRQWDYLCIAFGNNGRLTIGSTHFAYGDW